MRKRRRRSTHSPFRNASKATPLPVLTPLPTQSFRVLNIRPTMRRASLSPPWQTSWSVKCDKVCCQVIPGVSLLICNACSLLHEAALPPRCPGLVSHAELFRALTAPTSSAPRASEASFSRRRRVRPSEPYFRTAFLLRICFIAV